MWQISNVWRELQAAVTNEDPVANLLDEYAEVSRQNNEYIAGLIRLYEQELIKLKKEESCDLTPSQIAQLKVELDEFERLCNMGVRSQFGMEKFSLHDNLLGDLTDRVKVKCPLITSMLNALVTSETDRNNMRTNAAKFMDATHALNFLLNIKSRHNKNDFALLFGLMAISYGAGKQFIKMLHSMGLSLQWETL